MKAKKIIGLLILVLMIASLLLASCRSEDGSSMHLLQMEDGAVPGTGIINPDSEVRGVWVASVFNIDYPSRSGLDVQELKAELDSLLETCTANNLNTIYFQVRPSCDALYDSEIFPVSSFISDNGKLEFDPLEYLVKEGHLRNIFVHAWVNPLRVTVSEAVEENLPDDSPAKKHPEWTVKYADGKIYLNAGLPEVRGLVADGVREIVEKYDVDGIVFDDYFYPYPVTDESGAIADFNDSAAYLKYGSNAFEDIADWRRDNINSLIKLTYDTVKEIDSNCAFGVSPCGIWQNDDGANGGSETRGFEAYKSLYCDAVAWIKGGYIDFIAPQIYWSFDTDGTPFDTVIKWWNTVIGTSGVDLLVAHAAYRYDEGEWEDPSGEMTEQVEFARSEFSYRGSVFYGYSEIRNNVSGISDEVKKLFENEVIYTDPVSNGLGVSVSSPENGASVTGESTYILGMSDPTEPLYFNGDAVGRTKNGYFSLYVELSVGENSFVFEHKGQEYVYTVYRTSSSLNKDGPSNYKSLDSFGINNAFPSNALITYDNVIKVSCTAPAGADVTASLGNIVCEMSEDEVYESEQGKVPCADYSGTLILPKPEDSSASDFGRIIFSASDGSSSCEFTGGDVRILLPDEKLAVKVIRDEAPLKLTHSSLTYNDYSLQPFGMTDYAEELSGGFYRLRMGGYISENDVEQTSEYPLDKAFVENITVSDGTETTDITIKTDEKIPYNIELAEGNLIVSLYNADCERLPDASVHENPLISQSSYILSSDGNKARYSFLLKDEKNFYGYDVEYGEDSLIISLKNPVRLDFTCEKPLEGIKIVIDPGHGGEDSGALGPGSLSMTRAYEKNINLEVSLKCAEILQGMGAEVIMTREDDTFIPLAERAKYVLEQEPDISVSIHQNSMDYSSDIRSVRGTLSLWWADSGRLLSECIGKRTAAVLGRSYDKRRQMLAMCRSWKFPQALIEVGYMTCVEEYEKMIDGNGIDDAAQGIADGIIDYYKEQSSFIDAIA